MAEVEKKGSVTPLNSLFTSEEAEKAARVVDEARANRHKELRRLRDFISDNSALIRQVQKLPDELSHDIMVPFGGAAFFPGRLIHTNEFMVLLGEGYYAERTAKQTIEILQRRGKALDAHLESLNRIMKDLEMESKFFDSTAAEVSEGLVEIREEYAEETKRKEPEIGISNSVSLTSSRAHIIGVPDDEDEDVKLMARLDELEKEEEEAMSDLGDDEDDETACSSNVDEDEDYENAIYLKVDKKGDVEEENDEDEYVNDITKNISETDVKVSRSKMQVAPQGSLKSIVEQPDVPHHPLLPPETREYLQKPPSKNIQNSSENILSQSSNKMGFTERKAFPGTVIEHSYGLSPVKPSNESTSSQQSKPVSRFKMKRNC